MSLTSENIHEVTIEKTFDPEDIANHVLEPGDCVWLMNTDGTDVQGWGVVVKSDRNNEKRVEARIGGEPCRLYARTQLRWMGPLD